MSFKYLLRSEIIGADPATDVAQRLVQIERGVRLAPLVEKIGGEGG